MEFSDCISTMQDNRSDGGQTATTDFHTAYEKSENDQSNIMTIDHTMDNTDSMSENDKFLTEQNQMELNQESFMNSSRLTITDSQAELDI